MHSQQSEGGGRRIRNKVILGYIAILKPSWATRACLKDKGEETRLKLETFSCSRLSFTTTPWNF